MNYFGPVFKCQQGLIRKPHTSLLDWKTQCYPTEVNVCEVCFYFKSSIFNEGYILDFKDN